MQKMNNELTLCPLGTKLAQFTMVSGEILAFFLCLFTLQKIIQDKLKKINHDNNVMISQKTNEFQIIIKPKKKKQGGL